MISHSNSNSGSKTQQFRITGSTIKLWLVLLCLTTGSLACRLEVGLDPASASPDQTDSSAAVLSPPPPADSQTAPAAEVPAPQPAEVTAADAPVAEAPVVEAGASPAENSLPAEPMFTPTPTPSPTPVIPANSPPSRILIPSINLDTPVDLTTWEVNEQNGAQASAWIIPANAPGWHVNSALPGHGSNVVLSGHHNIGSEVFRTLVDVEPGAALTLQADGRDYLYTITDRFIVPERNVSQEQQTQNARWIMPTVDERVTLVTCWPYQDNSHRVIVIAKPIGG
jgi:sortase A